MDESREWLRTARYSYDYSKVVSQAIALQYAEYGLKVLVLAPTAVIGPMMENLPYWARLSSSCMRVKYRPSYPAESILSM